MGGGIEADGTGHAHRPTNREKAQEPRKRRFWCGCDRDTVGDVGRCKVCGARMVGNPNAMRRPGPLA